MMRNNERQSKCNGYTFKSLRLIKLLKEKVLFSMFEPYPIDITKPLRRKKKATPQSPPASKDGMSPYLKCDMKIIITNIKRSPW